MNAADLARVSTKFEKFGRQEVAAGRGTGSSRLYEHLALEISHDNEILALTAGASPGQPEPNMLFGAVHFLLLKQKDPAGALAEFYASVSSNPRSPGEAYPAFRTFCLENAAAIRRIVASRRVQTNEVGRCSYLFPAFVSLSTMLNGRSLELIEIGTSAGLNLNWDRYAYQFGNAALCGEVASAVRIPVEARGDIVPPVHLPTPRVASRTGIDLHILNVDEDDEVLWLRALVWPDHVDRMKQLLNAVAIAKAERPSLVEGDGIDLLPGLLRQVRHDSVPCVFHTHVLYQFPEGERLRFQEVLAQYGREHDLFDLGAEGSMEDVQLRLNSWVNGRHSETLLARCHAHGRWLEWLLPERH